jgi:hypothetical protein
MDDLMEGPEKVPVTAELPRDLLGRLNAEARRQAAHLMIAPNRARSAVIRMALVRFLDEVEQKPAA